ncbi:hypothetical protein ACVIGB_001051 [Bradyrhizobium sp. USDA 4341]
MAETPENNVDLVALVPGFHVGEFATVHTEYSASKGMSRVTMWVSRERGDELREAGLKLREEIRQRETQPADENRSLAP